MNTVGLIVCKKKPFAKKRIFLLVKRINEIINLTRLRIKIVAYAQVMSDK